MEAGINHLEKIFLCFKKNYGPQFWWPTTSAGEIIPKYQGGPVNEKQKLEVIFGSILMQNTAWKNAEKAIIELNKKDMIDIDKIIKIKEEELAQTIRSSGYYNQKSKKIKNMCYFLKENSLTELEKLETDELKELLLKINGVGKETADSIILYALNKPVFVVDAYSKRIFSRIGICKKDIAYDEMQKIFQEKLGTDAKLFNEYHALIVEHAKRYCQKVPLCRGCILENVCKKII